MDVRMDMPDFVERESGVQKTVSSFDNTMQFNFSEEPMDVDVREVLLTVYDALQEKGITQLTKLSATYCLVIQLTSLVIKMPENMIRKVDRDELIEELVKFYLRTHREE
nr:IreB family regulatory phosphoprotein [Anoxybacillus sp. KU2-6(11)]